MSGKFISASNVEREQPDWGAIGWFSRPQTTGSKHLTVLEVILGPGEYHDFHKHPDQEEIIYVMEGSLEQWLEKESARLEAGGAVYIPADTVHASFNTAGTEAKVIAILGPSVGDQGYELVDVSQEEPWKSIR